MTKTQRPSRYCILFCSDPLDVRSIAMQYRDQMSLKQSPLFYSTLQASSKAKEYDRAVNQQQQGLPHRTTERAMQPPICGACTPYCTWRRPASVLLAC